MDCLVRVADILMAGNGFVFTFVVFRMVEVFEYHDGRAFKLCCVDACECHFMDLCALFGCECYREHGDAVLFQFLACFMDIAIFIREVFGIYQLSFHGVGHAWYHVGDGYFIGDGCVFFISSRRVVRIRIDCHCPYLRIPDGLALILKISVPCDLHVVVVNILKYDHCRTFQDGSVISEGHVMDFILCSSRESDFRFHS